MTSLSTKSGGRQMTWTRESVIAAILRWVECYGEPPRAADWNPSSARWCAQEWRIERYRKGDPETGAPWPSLNAAKAPFGGSLNAALKAAGLEPNRSGPPKRTNVVLTEHMPMHPQARVALEAAEARVRDLEEHTAVLERQLARAREARIPRAPREVTKTKTKIETRVKTRTVVKPVIDTKAVGRVEERAQKRIAKIEAAATAKVEKATATVATERAKATEARAAATRAASKLERAEATITTLRDERRENVEALRAAELAETVATTELATAREEIERLRADRRVIVKDAPEQAAIDLAVAEAAAAQSAAHGAEVRAATAERKYLEIAAAVVGEQRKLTKAEMDELRANGPAGPTVLAAALKKLARAQNPTAKRAALNEVASAAVTWIDRL